MLAHIVVAFLTLSSALAAPHHGHSRRGYLKDDHLLEDYNQYKTRFNALGCSQERNTTFYHDCCHPLRKGQSLSSRPSYCDPNSDCHDTTETTTTTTTTPSDPNQSTTSPVLTTPTTTTTTTPYRKPHRVTTTTTTTPAPPKNIPTTSAPAPTTTSGGGGGGGGSHKGGQATFFYQNGVAGACGKVHSDSDLIAAMDSALYGSGGLCGKQVKLVGPNGSVVVTVADECPTCENANSIDLSVAAFEVLAGKPGDKSTLDLGTIQMAWDYV